VRAKKTLFMETTQVPAERTASEISSCLIQAGATQIATDYEAGKIKGLRWMMDVRGRKLCFAMPARVEPVFEELRKRRRQSFNRTELLGQAERVAWRQLLRWVQAQLAMIQCGMTEPGEVFFPFMMHVEANKTVYTLFAEQEFKMLAGPEKPQ
jgi:hypothetical protein